MDLREKLKLTGNEPLTIDWDMTPADAFGIFESWGNKRQIHSLKERCYYFYIDAWAAPARLFLMERGVKFARIMAQIDAPKDMIDACVAGQGKGWLDKTYAIDDALRKWLLANVIDTPDTSKVFPVESGLEAESLETGLPVRDDPQPGIVRVTLRAEPAVISEDEVAHLIRGGAFTTASTIGPEVLPITSSTTATASR